MAFNKRLFVSGEASGECTTETVTAFGANAANSTNYAVYKLDGNSDDVTNNYDATNNVSFNSSGKYGQSATFNNTNTVIELPSTIDDPMRSAGAFTVSLWYKHATQTNAYGGKILSLLNNIYNLITVHASNNTLTAVVSNSSNSSSSVTSSALSTGTWYHIVWTGNATNGVSLYIDSVLIGNAAWDGTFFTYTDANYKYNRLGYQNLSIASLVGELDQLRFFNRAVTSTEVAELYAETSTTTSNTNLLNDGAGVALYSFDYDASDTGGLYDGTPTDIDFGVGGQINTAAEFNGSSSRINLPVGLGTTGARSNSLWIKVDTFPSSSIDTFFYIGTQGANENYETMSVTSTSKVKFQQRIGSATDMTAIESSETIIAGNWYHVATTHDGTTAKLYINGDLSKGGSVSFSSYVNNSSLAGNLGAFHTATPSYDGSIDQYRRFHKALVQSEVDVLYAETACVHTSTTDIVDFPSGTTNAAYYKLDNSAEDSKGTNDGTETNIEYRFGRYGQAAVFNGSSSKIEVSDPVIPVGAASLSFWFNNDNTAGSLSGGETHYILGSGVSSSSKGLTAGFFQQKFFAVVNNGASSSSLTGTTLFSKTNWNHCVVTWDGTTGSNKLKIYVNGNLEIQGTSSIAASTIGTYTNFAIGGTLSSGFIGGRVDGVRIFGSELSAANVTKLYNEKPETDTSNFKTVLYEGTSAKQFISNVGMDLETDGGLVWIKSRTVNNGHRLYDSVRGATKALSSEGTFAEYTESGLTSFEDNGFFVGSHTGVNQSSQDFVSWVWKGGGTPLLNEIGDIDSSVSANTAAGFSIVSYTGTSTIGDTIGHGLGTPDLIIVKNRDNSSASWAVWSSTFSAASETLFLDATSPSNQYTNRFGTVNSNTFQAGSNGGTEVNKSGNKFIAYIFKSVAGYQKIGSYTGDGTTSGKIIYTTDDGTSSGSNGFEPSFLLTKPTGPSGGYWYILDNRRSPSNPRNDSLFPNDNLAEIESTNYNVDFLSNGFELKNNTIGFNDNNENYIFLAIK